MNKNILLLLIGFFFISCNEKTASKKEPKNGNKEIKDSLTFELNQIHKQGFINGFAVAIVNENEILYKKGIGYANIENENKYTENTIQNIASISKTFLGISLLKAQELGKLNLDDPINKYLPVEIKNPFYPNDPITIRHLATHTSTILDSDIYDEKTYILKNNNVQIEIKDYDETFNNPESKMPMIDFVEKILTPDGEWFLKERFLNNKPGEIFEYSNFGAVLGALVIENATGIPYDRFTTKYILEPLNMSSSGWSFNSIDFSKHSTMYANPNKELPFYTLITYPDGGMITSINDLSKYLLELINGYSGNGILINKESYKEYFKEQLASENFTDRSDWDAFDDEYNSGIFMGFSPKGYIGHRGSDPGIFSFLFFDPKTKVGRLLFVNTDLDSDGMNEFMSIWKKLDEYSKKIIVSR